MADDRGIEVEFAAADAFQLERLGRRFKLPSNSPLRSAGLERRYLRGTSPRKHYDIAFP